MTIKDEEPEILSFLLLNFCLLTINMSVFIGLEGFTLPEGFIVKEICLIYPNDEYNHFLFKKPDGFLSEISKKTIRYTTQHLNNLSYEDGDISCNLLPAILEKVKDLTIYTYSDIAQKFLQHYLPTTAIENVQNQGNKIPSQLPDSKCFRSHNQRYCARAKAIAIKKFVDL